MLQRAKAILVAWEELQKKERDTKYSTLQEKVVLQRELITRQDQMQLITATNKIATSAQVDYYHAGCIIDVLMYVTAENKET